MLSLIQTLRKSTFVMYYPAWTGSRSGGIITTIIFIIVNFI